MFNMLITVLNAILFIVVFFCAYWFLHLKAIFIVYFYRGFLNIIHTHTYIHAIYIYHIYIYILRDRERKRGFLNHIYIYIYIFIYI